MRARKERERKKDHLRAYPKKQTKQTENERKNMERNEESDAKHEKE